MKLRLWSLAAACGIAGASLTARALAEPGNPVAERAAFKLSVAVFEQVATLGEPGPITVDGRALFNQGGLDTGQGLQIAEGSAGGKPGLPASEPGQNGSPARTAQAKAGGAGVGKSLGGASVDWSKWAGELADRWYKNLTALEKRSGKQFTTRRPARIKFTCYPDGSIKGISLYRSCGVPEYDRMQIEALKQTQPLPPFPAGSKRKSFTLLQGWESHPLKKGETEFRTGSYGKAFPTEKLGGPARPRQR